MEINKIYCMDCIEGMKKLEDKSIDLIVTSPPYNIRNTVGGGFTSKKGLWNNPTGLKKGYGEYTDDIPYDEYVMWQRDCLKNMMRILKEDGAIFYNHKWRVQNGLLQGRYEIVKDFPVRQIIIWYRKTGMNFNDGYFVPMYEIIYLITKPNFKLKKGYNGLGDVWTILPEKNSPHPVSFPMEIPKRCIESSNAKIVCDPFIGYGTTAIACKQLNRNFIGFDNNQEYVDIANERIKKYCMVDKWL